MARTLLISVAVVLALMAPATALAAPTTLGQPFNDDVIVNQSGKGFDEGEAPMDSSTTLLTQSAASLLEGCADDPQGLPDDGHFPSIVGRPSITLITHNYEPGPNADQLVADGASVSGQLDTAAPFQELQLIATAADGHVDIDVDITYEDGSTERVGRRVSDWLGEPAPGDYTLIDGLDRANLNSSPYTCVDTDSAAIFGLRVPVDPRRAFKSVTITRTAGASGASRLTIFRVLLLPPQPLKVNVEGAGTGDVTRSVAGLPLCGPACEVHPESTAVTLTAQPGPGSSLAGWSAEPPCSTTFELSCVMNMDGPKTTTVYFAPPPEQGDAPGGDAPGGGDGPGGPGGPDARRLQFGELVDAPGARRCIGKRLRVGVRKIKGEQIRSAKLTIGKRSRTLRGRALSRAAYLSKLPKKAFTLRVVVTTADGDRFASSRRYKRCAAKRRA